jgi:P27 family predicted phage terminase small subunit
VNAREPKHATIDPTLPPELEAREPEAPWLPLARGEWLRIVETLGHGHVTTVDRGTLIAYCLKYGQWITYERAAGLEEAIIAGKTGYLMPNPRIALANRAYTAMLKAAVELGITPSSRSRIVAAPSKADPAIAPDEFTKFQRRRTNLK